MSTTSSHSDSRSTESIFQALTNLCVSPGYIYALCNIAVTNNYVNLASGASKEQWMTHHRPDRLNRSEQVMLAGLLLKHSIDYTEPTMDTMTYYIARTHELLQMLHESLSSPLLHQHPVGQHMREPIFYSAESAQPFQYGDFAAERYRKDEGWLRERKGFSIDDAIVVAQTIHRHQKDMVTITVSALSQTDAVSPSLFYHSLAFSLDDLSATIDLDSSVILAILQSFCSMADERNVDYRSPGDFNIARARPIIRRDDKSFILFDHDNLMESLYISPYYWMVDTSYKNTASRHRGEFAEQIVYLQLRHVFGERHVFRNVQLKNNAGHVHGEIDVLVVFGNRIVVSQVKSKQLTYPARQGDDMAITRDFEKGIQAAYNQCVTTARMIMDGGYSYEDRFESKIRIPLPDLKIYLLCITSDDYPALGYQTEHFLEETHTNDVLKSPFVCDVFCLDTVTELLDSPLRFLSYVDRRLIFRSKIISEHELTTLGYHLSHNLWIDNNISILHVDESFSATVDATMYVRRLQLPGDRVPKGALTPFVNSALGDIISELEIKPGKAGIDLGMFLLTLPPNACDHVNQKINAMIDRAVVSLHPHGCSYMAEALGVGLTVYSGYNRTRTNQMLNDTVRRRMSEHDATCWFGMLMDPDARRPYLVGERGSWERALDGVSRTVDRE